MAKRSSQQALGDEGMVEDRETKSPLDKIGHVKNPGFIVKTDSAGRKFTVNLYEEDITLHENEQLQAKGLAIGFIPKVQYNGRTRRNETVGGIAKIVDKTKINDEEETKKKVTEILKRDIYKKGA